MRGTQAPALFLLLVTFAWDSLRASNITALPKLCDMRKDMMRHFFTCAYKILQKDVVTLLKYKYKRFFKGRDVVDSIADMCPDAWPMLNNNVPLTVMQVKDEDKPFTEHALWICMNATRYMMAH
ncbi:uncharacterized protein [Dermacentor andersoni]|uniref:uncharacterized protein isoform X1 n=1 Tax=Dermacentor andersoni TaxID=34620 RepID=UPI003B3BE127